MTAPSPDLSLALPPRVMSASGPLAGPRPPAVGPGWFESSWDLRRGLEVHESGDADARLRCWIEEFLGAQLGASPGAAGASFSAT